MQQQNLNNCILRVLIYAIWMNFPHKQTLFPLLGLLSDSFTTCSISVWHETQLQIFVRWATTARTSGSSVASGLTCKPNRYARYFLWHLPIHFVMGPFKVFGMISLSSWFFANNHEPCTAVRQRVMTFSNSFHFLVRHSNHTFPRRNML